MVSIIVPIYNVEQYLEKCIDSIINQTLKDIEIILVDDGSPDNCGQICDEYAKKDNRIKVIHKENGGLSSARNAGLKIATGEYIGFIDSDDYIELNMYEELYNIAKENNIDIVSCNYNRIAKEIRKSEIYLPANKVIIKNEINDLIKKSNYNKMLWYVWKALYKREIIEKINFIEKPIIEDTPFNLEAYLKSNSIYHLDKPLYNYIHRENSIMCEPYKKDLILKLNNQYIEKLNIYKKYNLSGYEEDLYLNNMCHLMPMILDNVKNHKVSLKDKIKEYKYIRNCQFVIDTFNNISVFEIKTKVKYLVLLLKFRLYFILLILTK